jgi:hypothetical protein
VTTNSSSTNMISLLRVPLLLLLLLLLLIITVQEMVTHLTTESLLLKTYPVAVHTLRTMHVSVIIETYSSNGQKWYVTGILSTWSSTCTLRVTQYNDTHRSSDVHYVQPIACAVMEDMYKLLYCFRGTKF